MTSDAFQAQVHPVQDLAVGSGSTVDRHLAALPGAVHVARVDGRATDGVGQRDELLELLGDLVAIRPHLGPPVPVGDHGVAAEPELAQVGSVVQVLAGLGVHQLEGFPAR